MEVSLQFFLLSEEQKKNYSRGSFREENHGWVSLETERYCISTKSSPYPGSRDRKQSEGIRPKITFI